MLPEDSRARLIWSVLEDLEFSNYECRYRNDETGRPAVDPRSLVGVWILGLLRGVSSSVVVSRLCETDIEFRWLLGGASVEKSTLCDFRKNHLDQLGDLSTQVLVGLAQCGLVNGEEVGIDGTILQAVSSRSSVRKRKSLQKSVKRLREAVEEKLSQEESEESAKKMVKRKERFERALQDMDSLGLTGKSSRMNIAEPEASLKKLKDGRYRPGYNVQVVSDLSSGAIISTGVTDAGNDRGQLGPQLEKARESLADISEGLQERGEQDLSEINSVVADSQYHYTRNLVDLHEQIDTYVPDGWEERSPPGVSEAFLADKFIYDENTDTMVCPEGKTLRRRSLNAGKTAMRYEAGTKDCLSCCFKGECCPKSKGARTVSRQLYPEVLQATRERVQSEKGQRLKTARHVAVEGCMSRLKEFLGWRRCVTWGLKGAQCELTWRQLAHNIMLLTGIWKPLAVRAAT